MNQPRPRGRAGALAIVTLTAILTALALLQTSSIKTAYARPLPLGGGDPRPVGAAHSVGPGAAWTFGRPIPAWEVLRPGAADVLVPPGRNPIQVPILMYHYIRNPPNRVYDQLGWGLSTSPADFRAQMDYLDRNGFHPITINDLHAYLNGSRSLPDRPVILTFDDGYTDLYTEAFPVLRQHNFKAVAYIISGYLGSNQNVSADQVKEMDAYGIEIGAHTVSHIDLTTTNPSRLLFEVKGSKDSLESLLGHPVNDFCYPAGRYDATVMQAVQSAGFWSATTTKPGAIHSGDDRFTWTRVRVSGSESLAAFSGGLLQHEDGMPPVSMTPIVIPRVYPLIFPPLVTGPE